MMIGYDPYEAIGVLRWLCARHQDRWHHPHFGLVSPAASWPLLKP